MGEEIIREILRQQDKILSNIEAESISVYLFLKDEYAKGNVQDNTLFQFVFRSYYRLDNGGLGVNVKKRYFELLADSRNDLKEILLELYKIHTLRNRSTIQFSFATKLLHTINNNLPIFDAEVSRVLRKRVVGANREEKIQSCLEVFTFLKDVYSNLLRDEQVKKLVLRFREQFGVDKNKMSDVKILDFIIWSLGKMGIKK